MQPRPSGRLGGRDQHGRRRRHPPADPRPVPPRRRRLRPPARRLLRGGHGVPAPRHHRRREDDGPHRDDRGGRGPAGPRLAHDPDRRLHDRAHRAERDPELPPPLHRRPRRRERHRARPEALRRPQALRARDHERRVDRRPQRVLPVALVPHPRLQGDAHHAAARRVLRRPGRRARGVGARAGAQPLLHEHVPVVAARAPVPLHRAQRRDQHRAGQPELAARARVDDEHTVDPRVGARVPDHHAGCVRHRELRRVPRAVGARRPADLARRAHDDPGGLGEPRDDVAGEARLLPVPLVAHGAVGRSRIDRVHRRHRDRRGARPQRPPPESLLGDRRRPRDHGERDRRGRRRSRHAS